MKMLKLIRLVYKEDICICFAFTLAVGILSNLICDIAIFTGSDNVPSHLGSVLALIIGSVCIILANLANINKFFILISAGETRHRYFFCLVINKIIMAAGVSAIALLCFFIEQLKINTIYSGYGFTVSNDLPDKSLLLCLVMIMFIFVSVLVTALVLHFGKKIWSFLCLVPLCLILLLRLINRLTGTSGFSFLGDNMLVTYIIILVLSAAFFFVARFMIMRQEVR